MQTHGMRKPRRSKSQLSFGNRGYSEISHRNFHQTAIDGRAVPLDNAARDIGVEQISGHPYLPDQNNSRFCGTSSWRSVMKSSGRFASRRSLKKLSHDSGRRDRITSPVVWSWRIKTSRPSKRKSAGRGTACLRSLSVTGSGLLTLLFQEPPYQPPPPLDSSSPWLRFPLDLQSYNRS